MRPSTLLRLAVLALLVDACAADDQGFERRSVVTPSAAPSTEEDERDAGVPVDEPVVDAGADPTPADAGDTAERIPSPVPGKKVTYAYGVKNSSYSAGYHTGEDYATATGSRLVAVRGGSIQWSNDNGGAYGKWMGLKADNGRVYVYCHLSVRDLEVGDVVKAGDTIGRSGATGNVTGPHLHFEDHPAGPFKYGEQRKPAW